MSRRKAPKGCYWRGGTLWGRVMVARREVRFSLRTSEVEIAKGRLKAKRDRLIAAAHYGDQRRTWKDVYVAWSDHIVGNVKPSTAVRYAVSLDQLEPWLEGLYLDEIDRACVSGIVKERRARGTSNATIRRDLSALSSVLGYAEGEEWREGNPALDALRTLKERRDPIALPQEADIARVIQRAPGLFSSLIRAARLTGCRQDELVTLQRPQLDQSRKQITLYRTKNGNVRTIDMLDAAPLFASLPVNLGTKHVFWHGAAEPYRNVASRFRAIVLAAQESAQREGVDFRPFRFHDLRHLFAVEYLKNRKGSLYDLQQHLGHSSVKVTEIYLRYLTGEEARIARDGVAQS